MDTKKIGLFLKELRKEKGMTQEQLGERIGVTNKTVSRWENGNYMPPIECLTTLSDIYDISINEIVSGQRLSNEEFNNAAEENLSNALELCDETFKKTEKGLMTAMVISTLLAIVTIFLLPTDKNHIVPNIIIIALITSLAFISNSVILIAFALNKERYRKKF